MTFIGPPLPWFIPKAVLCLKEHSVYIAKSNFKTIYVLSLYICRLIKGKLGLWQYFLNFPFLLPPIAPSLQLLPRTWSSKPPEQSHRLSSQGASVSTSFFSILQHKALVVTWQVWGPWWVGWERLHHVRLECPSVSMGWALASIILPVLNYYTTITFHLGNVMDSSRRCSVLSKPLVDAFHVHSHASPLPLTSACSMVSVC